jgi:tetratricopeptide (TPR) repeat protein
MMRGNARLLQGELKQAIDDYDVAIQLDPKFTTAYFNRARAWMHLAAFDKALVDLNRVIELDPGYPDAHGSRGQIFGQLRRFDEAIRDFSTEIENFPDTAGGWYVARAMIWIAKGEFRKALTDMQTAVEDSPHDPRILNAAAWFMATCPQADVRDGPTAVRHATSACKATNWKEPSLIDTLAAAYAETGQFAEAAKWMRQAMELAPSVEKEDFASRLRLYLDGQAYRDENMGPGPRPASGSGDD